MNQPSEKVARAEAARLLDMSLTALALLDDELAPERVGRQRIRIYSRAKVEALAGRRAAEREVRSRRCSHGRPLAGACDRCAIDVATPGPVPARRGPGRPRKIQAAL